MGNELEELAEMMSGDMVKKIFASSMKAVFDVMEEYAPRSAKLTRTMYDAYRMEGFSDDQAMALVCRMLEQMSKAQSK